MSKVVLFCADSIGERMAGPAIRYWEMARALSAYGLEVTLAVPNRTDMTSADFSIAPYQLNPRLAHALAAGSDAFVIQGFALYEMPALRQTGKPMIVDLYDPFILENLENNGHKPSVERHRLHRVNTSVLRDQIALGDYFLCASERQRDFWLGMLSACGRIGPATYAGDQSLTGLIGIVPFGLPTEPPQHYRQVLKGVWPGIKAEDCVLLWGGSILEWFDPLTLIRAVRQVIEIRPDVKLFFLGRGHPNPLLNSILPVETYSQAVRLAREMGLADSHVFFNDRWVPYGERSSYLLEADIGVSIHRDYVETLFSFRTRLLDYIWADLPMIVSSGDSLSEEVVGRYDLGKLIRPGDVEGVAAAILELAAIPELRAVYRPRFVPVKEQFCWNEGVRPLVDFCRRPHFAADRRREE